MFGILSEDLPILVSTETVHSWINCGGAAWADDHEWTMEDLFVSTFEKSRTEVRKAAKSGQLKFGPHKIASDDLQEDARGNLDFVQLAFSKRDKVIVVFC